MRQRISSLLARATMTLLLAVLTTVTAWADTWPEYISEVKVLGASASNITALKTQYKNAGWTIIDFELNDGADGDWIYLAYKTASRNSTNGGYITDFYISNHKGVSTLPSSVSYDGKTYNLCDYDGDSYFRGLKGDLNSNAGGDDIHLYYTKANFSDKRVVSGIYFNSTQSGAVKKNGNEGNGYDLNAGAGGSYIYMHLTTTTKTNRPSNDPVKKNNLVYNGSAQNLITINNSNTGTMMYRVGTSGSYSSSIPTATNAATYTVYYYAASNDYGNTSSTHSTSVSIAKSPNSGVTVSCADIVEGNAPAPQLGGTNLSNGAVSYTYCTTQNGSYSSTVPTEPGTYYVKATVAADGNCNAYTTEPVSFTIRRDWALYSTGDSEADAYVISTTDELDLLAQRVNAGTDYKNKFFKLGDDITYSHTKDWDDATSTENNYTPIGDSNSHGFKGTFDGNGKTVSGIRISLKYKRYNGLFGYIDDGATVKNVIVSDARIIGWDDIGGIAGECNYSTITNCWVKSNVCIGIAAEIGGITGYGYNGTISGCRSEATLTAIDSDKSRFGGIVGDANSIAVSQCIVVGATIPDVNYRGAVVGVKPGSTLTNNYYTACTVAGVVNATNVGCNGADANGARQTVAIGAATGVTITPVGTETNYNLSGITAYEGNNGIIYGGQLYAGAGETVTFNIEYTVPEGCTLNGFTDGNGNALADNGDGTYTLTMTSAAPTITPDIYDPWGVTQGRDGSTAAKAYLITTPAGLDLLASKVNGGTDYENTFFELGDDIAYDPDVENNYTAIGCNIDVNTYRYFNGHFDGKGHTVSGIHIYKNATTATYLGLFGAIGSSAEVKNVILANSTFAGYCCIGGIAGYIRLGTVQNCRVMSTVSILAARWNGSELGGITGANVSGSVMGCVSAAVVSRNGQSGRYIGGIVGNNIAGSVKDCLYIGSTVTTSTSDNHTGAIIGYQQSSCSHINCYHTVINLNGLGGNNSNQDGVRFAVVTSSKPSSFGDVTATYGEGDYIGIKAYGTNGLEYDGKYYWNGLWGGSGTSSDPYIIYNTAGLDKLATDVNGGTTYQGKYFELGADITYNKAEQNNYTPIGGEDYDFCGHFDGKGHTIRGIRISGSSDFVGIFVINAGMVKNLTVSDCQFAGDYDVSAVVTFNFGTVENCHVMNDVTVAGKNGVGGVVDENEGSESSVKGCSCAATIKSTSVGDEYFGGIASINAGTLVDNLFTGTFVDINAGSAIGAITGSNDGVLTNNFHTVDGMGGVGNVGDNSNSDEDGAQIAVASNTKPDSFGDATATYGTVECPGIAAYASGLAYGGKYYYYGTTPPIEPGDANGDGNISVTDIAVVVNCILQLANNGGFSQYGADANGDGQITVTDIGVIVDKILGTSNNNSNAGARRMLLQEVEPQ